MPTAEYDLQYLQAAAGELEAYLLSKDLHWPLGVSAPTGEPPFPTLSLEGLLLSQKRLAAQELSASAASQRQDVLAGIQGLRAQWRTAWEQKATRAFHARLGLWCNFVDDLLNNPGAHSDRYAYEVRQRAMLHLLAEESRVLPANETAQLAAVDLRLKARWRPGAFIWPAALQPGFPADVYWYLHGQLIAPKITAG